jgi:hypothetical protein
MILEGVDVVQSCLSYLTCYQMMENLSYLHSYITTRN